MLKHGILGLLNYRQMTGYEIKEVFRNSLNYFWDAQTSQIYRELQTLRERGWVTDETDVPPDRANKKPFSITDEGRAELCRWLRDESVRTDTNSPLLMKTFFLGELEEGESLAFFRALRERSRASAAVLARARDAVEEYSRQIPERKKAMFWQMTRDFGVMYNEMLEKWAEHCEEMITEVEK